MTSCTAIHTDIRVGNASIGHALRDCEGNLCANAFPVAQAAEVAGPRVDFSTVSVPAVDLSSIELHRDVLDDLFARTNRALRAGRNSAAAALVGMAADFASRHHPGWFAHTEFEEMIATVGSSISTPASDTPRIGHVHLVDVSASAPVLDIAEKMQLVAADHSEVVIVEPGHDVLEVASGLRAEIDDYEVVFLHTEPQAVEMSLALAGWRSRPPVVVVNHHETVFWSGAGVADMVVSHTATGRALGIDRRYVSPGRSRLLPGRDASPEVWRTWVDEVDTLVRAVHPAWLPGACLPSPIFPNDFEVVRRQRTAGRSDGLAAAWFRSGSSLCEPERPPLSVVVIGNNADTTVECLHRVLDASPGLSAPQMVVVDTGRDPDMATVVGDLAGLVLLVPFDHSVGEDPGAEGLRWCWAVESVVIDDRCQPDGAVWREALDELRSAGSSGLVSKPDDRGVDQLFLRTELITVGADNGTFGEKSSRLVTP